ncbi:uncharacterized protein LOC134518942 [Chroicocephalus ridibundus]|uniref:uncharacterized protein LOC134518942 n=1 Tax=Chroicocephalus ridibundus TaxID=1192867 RepID=UPI002FDEB802
MSLQMERFLLRGEGSEPRDPPGGVGAPALLRCGVSSGPREGSAPPRCGVPAGAVGGGPPPRGLLGRAGRRRPSPGLSSAGRAAGGGGGGGKRSEPPQFPAPPPPPPPPTQRDAAAAAAAGGGVGAPKPPPAGLLLASPQRCLCRRLPGRGILVSRLPLNEDHGARGTCSAPALGTRSSMLPGHPGAPQGPPKVQCAAWVVRVITSLRREMLLSPEGEMQCFEGNKRKRHSALVDKNRMTPNFHKLRLHFFCLQQQSSASGRED